MASGQVPPATPQEQLHPEAERRRYLPLSAVERQKREVAGLGGDVDRGWQVPEIGAPHARPPEYAGDLVREQSRHHPTPLRFVARDRRPAPLLDVAAAPRPDLPGTVNP